MWFKRKRGGKVVEAKERACHFFFVSSRPILLIGDEKGKERKMNGTEATMDSESKFQLGAKRLVSFVGVDFAILGLFYSFEQTVIDKKCFNPDV